MEILLLIASENKVEFNATGMTTINRRLLPTVSTTYRVESSQYFILKIHFFSDWKFSIYLLGNIISVQKQCLTTLLLNNGYINLELLR